MTNALDTLKPIKRPEHAALGLIEAILSFETLLPYRDSDPAAQSFRQQPAPVKEAIRRHWVTDHLPTYAMVTGISLSDFERELAERFWADVRAVEQINRRRKRHRESRHDLEVRNVTGPPRPVGLLPPRQEHIG